MYFNSWVDVWNKQRTALLGNSQIGHSEIILKTELAKKLPPHGSTMVMTGISFII